MIARIVSILCFALPSLALASPLLEMPSRPAETTFEQARAFRAPHVMPIKAVSLGALEKSAVTTEETPGGPIRVGTVRILANPARIESWTPVAGGYVARWQVASLAAKGLRVRLGLGAIPGPMELRVQGTNDRVESMIVDPLLGPQAWGPWTEGSEQVVELFSAVLPSPGAVQVESISHFTDSPFEAKLASACTVDVTCTTNTGTLDAAINERKKSVMKIIFDVGNSSFICSATLINTEKFPAAYVLTANHCIDTPTGAGSITSIWFYEDTTCGGSPSTGTQVSGGMQLVFTNYNVDSSLLLMNLPPPAGAVYSAWNKAHLATGDAIVSLSHPKGDVQKLALGNVTNEYRIEGRPQDEYGVHFTRGIIEGGSSGSGLFALSGNSLQLRGILTGTTVRNGALSCTNLMEEGLYGRFDIFEPEIDQYIRIAPQAPDDAPNRVVDFAALLQDPNGADKQPLDQRTSPLTISNLKIDYAGDIDLFRFTLSSAATVNLSSQGALDTVGAILSASGLNIVTNDDGAGNAANDYNFGITQDLDPGTYYLLVGHWEPQGTGTYSIKMSATPKGPTGDPVNYTDLWWNPSESGWGLNLNHQGTILFGTLFTYDATGAPMWLVMSSGAKQTEGNYQGLLYRTVGPPFNATPWSAITATQVGTMRVSFSDASNGTLTYTLSGVTVVKSITRQVFATRPTCTWSTSDRSAATNYQDLWWNPTESGWGVNVTHQGNIVFATLFTYDTTGKAAWYVMPSSTRTGSSFSGTLYSTTGPAFNASPWASVNANAVGTMTFNFASGNSATLTYTINGVSVTKSIQRQVFSSPMTQCSG